MPRNCWTRCNKTFPCSFPAREKTREIESRETSRCLEKQVISALLRKMIYKFELNTLYNWVQENPVRILSFLIKIVASRLRRTLKSSLSVKKRLLKHVMLKTVLSN